MDQNMKVTVYHREMTETGFNGSMTRVAIVEAPTDDVTEALSYAYRWTNNVMGSWSLKDEIEDNRDSNDNVEFVGGFTFYNGQKFGARSTSVGDIMYVDNGNSDCYEVMPIGFRCVSVEEDAA